MKNEEKTLNSTQIYNGKVIQVFEDEVLCANGNISKREIVKHHGGVCILAIIEDKVLIEKQYRYAYNEILYELPAGKLEKNENAYDAALRELEEETGYKAKHLVNLGQMYPTCGYSNEIIHLFLAQDLTKTKTHFDEDEFIDLEVMDLNEVIDLINQNKIKDAKTICLIFKYIQYRN